MSRIKRAIHPGDKFHSTEVLITFAMFKNHCKGTKTDPKDLMENGKHFVPGVMLVGMFRHVVKKIGMENTNFPLKKLESFYGSNLGGTIENRLFVGEKVSVIYKLKYTCKMEGKAQYLIEVCRKEDDSIVLQGIYSFI